MVLVRSFYFTHDDVAFDLVRTMAVMHDGASNGYIAEPIYETIWDNLQVLRWDNYHAETMDRSMWPHPYRENTMVACSLWMGWWGVPADREHTSVVEIGLIQLIDATDQARLDRWMAMDGLADAAVERLVADDDDGGVNDALDAEFADIVAEFQLSDTDSMTVSDVSGDSDV